MTDGPTADQKREIDKAYEQLNTDWFVDTNTKEIRRRERTLVEGLSNFLWPNKHSVWQLYWWLRRLQIEHPIMLALGNPIQSDNMPINGHPMKYELQSGWTIPQADLKFLKDGPLMSENLGKMLVPSSGGLRSVFGFAKQIAPLFTIASGTIAIISKWPEIVGLFPPLP